MFHHHPLRPVRSLVVLSFTLMALFAALALPTARTAAAAPKERAVTGQFHMQVLVGPDCPSPVGVCATGTATGDIPGDVFVVITGSSYGVDAGGNPVSNYTADISISNNKGRLNGTIVGQTQLATGNLASTVTFVSGTKYYHKTTGTLNVTGNLNFVTGVEEDSFTGTLSK